jgi:hypothetical protein
MTAKEKSVMVGNVAGIPFFMPGRCTSPSQNNSIHIKNVSNAPLYMIRKAHEALEAEIECRNLKALQELQEEQEVKRLCQNSKKSKASSR